MAAPRVTQYPGMTKTRRLVSVRRADKNRDRPDNPNKRDGRGRIERQRARPPVDPYRRDVRAAARLRYGGEERALEQQLAQSGVNQQQNTTWFQDYQNQLEKSRIAQASFYQGQQAAAQNLATQTAAPTQFTGQTGSDVQADSLKAADVRKAIQEGFAEALGQQASTYNAAKEDQKGVASAAQLTARQAEQRRADMVRGEQRALKADKGAFKTKYRTELEDREHTKTLERAAFKLDAYEAQTDAAADAAEGKRARRAARRERREERNEVNEWGYTNREWSRMSPAQRREAKGEWDRAGDKPDKPDTPKEQFSPKDRRENRITLRKAIAKVKQNDNGLDDYWRTAQRGLISAGVDPALARAAARAATGKPIPKALERTLLRDYGIRVRARGQVNRPEPYLPPGPVSEKG